MLKPLAFHYNVDTESLKHEVRIRPKTIKLYEAEKKCKIDTVMKFIDFLVEYKNAFNEPYKLGLICITIPVSSAACERTFSTMKRLEDFLRNSMADDRLHDLAVLYVEKDLSKRIDMEEVVDIFSTAHKNLRIILH